MNEITKIVVTAAVTIFGSVVVYAFSQLLSKIVLDPLNDQRRIIGEIDYALTFYAGLYATPIPYPYSNAGPDREAARERELAGEKIREHASRLLAATNAIRWYPIAARIGAP